MRIRMLCASLLLAALALAFPVNSFAATDNTTVPQITDRYASINDLTTSQSDDERVIIETTVQVLTSANQALNGLPVRFTGEAVGDILSADKGHKWVNVLGSSGASIGVYMTNKQAKRVVNLGDYHTAGSTLMIEGTYTMACSSHQGELDVHATSVRVLDTGGKVTHAFPKERLFTALGLCVFGFLLFALFIVLRRRSEARRLNEHRLQKKA